VNQLTKTLYIELPQSVDNVSLRILNMDGRQIVRTKRLNSSINYVNLSQSKQGIYIVVLNDGKSKIFSSKIIIQ